MHIASKLLEDALRGWGLGTTQDASDSTWLLEAPSPLVLVVVVIPSWRWPQWRKACVTLRAVLARLIPPGTLARLVLPAILTRSIAPLLVGSAVVPASPTSSSSPAVAAVAALRASTEAPVADGPELLTVIGVVAVYIVEGAERTAALG